MCSGAGEQLSHRTATNKNYYYFISLVIILQENKLPGELLDITDHK
jgi:hypothetical protein